MNESLVVEQTPEPPRTKPMDALKEMWAQPAFRLWTLILLAVLFVFWPLLKMLPPYWLNMDSYYAHGLLVPFCSAYIIYQRWDRIKTIPVSSSRWAIIPLVLIAGVLYITAIASRAPMPLTLSGLFVMTLMLSVWFVAGWNWMWAVSPGILFLMLGFPILDRVIDNYTFTMQQWSTRIAYHMLKVAGVQPFWDKDAPTVIVMPNWTMEVAVACSGLKTTIAVSACVLFLMAIGRLRWWANVILALVAIPLSVVINGLRVAMIGGVGNTWGGDAGTQFHDYSGYIALIVCFLILGKLSKWLGYK